MDVANVVGALVYVALSIVLVVALGYALFSKNFCPDSHDGKHHDFRVRTTDGLAVQCANCGRLSAGVKAPFFARQAK